MRSLFFTAGTIAGIIGGYYLVGYMLTDLEDYNGRYSALRPILPIVAWVMAPILGAAFGFLATSSLWNLFIGGLGSSDELTRANRIAAETQNAPANLSTRCKLMSRGETFTIEVFFEAKSLDSPITFYAVVTDNEGRWEFPAQYINKGGGRIDWMPENPNDTSCELMVFTDYEVDGNPYATYRGRIWQGVPWDDWPDPTGGLSDEDLLI